MAYRRRKGASPDTDTQAANRLSVTLGVVVASLLALLLVLLSVFDAFVFSWWAVLAALAVIAVPVCFALGWQQRAPFDRAGASRVLAGIAGALLAALLVLPIGVAAATQQPELRGMEASTEALAIAKRDGEPLPVSVQSLIDRTADAQSKAHSAQTDRDSVADELAEAERIRDKARRQIAHRSTAVAEDQDNVDHLQTEYDDWEDLQQDLDSYDTDPDLTPSIPDVGSGGTGGGSYGLCQDGTPSYSIGKQGACSHHGGVL
jgi:hypothetical protein